MSATPIKFPIPDGGPPSYEWLHEHGWNSHRNGISGRGFWAGVVDGRLTFAVDRWADGAWSYGSTPATLIRIPLAMLAPFVDMPTGDHITIQRSASTTLVAATQVAVISDGAWTITVFDYTQPGATDRIVLYTVPDPDGGGDIACAVTLEEILAGDTSSCWRGDNLAAYTAPWRQSRA